LFAVPTGRTAHSQSLFRTASIALTFAAVFVVATVWLPPVPALAIGTVLAVAGVLLLARPRWRTGSLLLASLMASLTGAEAVFGVLAPPPVNRDMTKISTPSHWTISDPVVGYRPKPATTVDVIGKYGDELIYHKTYTIEASGARATPGSQAGGPTYLFIGDSYIFGEGLNDDETLPSQFAQHLGVPAHVVNLGVLGYGPNHLVRAIESGLYDKYVVGKVAAVITWSTSLQMPRVIGDGGWLGSSPRYVLDASGHLNYTGTFYGHRLRNPLDGAWYLARTYLAAAARAAEPEIERRQADLYVALTSRLRDVVRERFRAPLVMVYDWPDQRVQGEFDQRHAPIFKALKRLGLPYVQVRDIIDPMDNWHNFFIPHDGHPNAMLDARIARDLLKTMDLEVR
jgi:hypothetical protein